MVPLLVYTYHRRPQWRAPIAFLIVFILVAPLVLLYLVPLPRTLVSLQQRESLHLTIPLFSSANWTVTVPWPSDFFQFRVPFSRASQNNAAEIFVPTASPAAAPMLSDGAPGDPSAGTLEAPPPPVTAYHSRKQQYSVRISSDVALPVSTPVSSPVPATASGAAGSAEQPT